MPFNPQERDCSGKPWLRLLQWRTARQSPNDFMAKMDITTRRMLASAECPSHAARLRALLLRMELLQGYSTSLSGTESAVQISSAVAAVNGYGRTIQRQWVYDTGAAACTIGRDYLSATERASIEQIPAKLFSTANGTTTCTEVAWCKVPHLGMRRCYVLKECSPLI